MTTKQTDRVLIQQFGDQGIQLFNQIEETLKALVIQTAEVAYKGENALAFKTKCTQSAVEFSNQCSQSMQQMSQVVTDNTTFIATALGGTAITLEPPSIVVEMPKVDADTSVEMAESGPLVDLRSAIQVACDSIEQSFNENLDNLNALGAEGWIGPEYDETLGAVTNLTSSIVDDVANSRTVMMSDVTNQLQALGME